MAKKRAEQPAATTSQTDAQPENRKRLAQNVTSMRSLIFRQLLDPRRDIDDECGYPPSRYTGYVNPSIYQQLFDREPVAARVVELYPSECWQVAPLVFEDEDPDIETPFEAGIQQLMKWLRGEESRFGGDTGNPLWEYLYRADLMSGLGSYGVIFLGLDDGRPFSEPAETRAGQKLLYLRVFPEMQAQVTVFNQDHNHPRYGLPETYRLVFNDPREQSAGIAAIGYQATALNVHWSRVIHVADNLHSSEVFGIPRMRPVLNRLLDLRKVYGGSAEMYWRGAFPGYSTEADPRFAGDYDLSGLQDQLEQYMNGLQRYLAVVGFNIKSLAPQVVDPSRQIAAQIEAICIKLGCPVRVFRGSERGELASSQDDAQWNDQLRRRQNGHITPRIIVPFLDRLIGLGVLASPSEAGYQVQWPDLDSQTDQQRADIAMKRAQAISFYQTSNAQSLIDPVDFLCRVLGYSEDEARQMAENAMGGQDVETIMPGDEPEPPASAGQQQYSDGDAEGSKETFAANEDRIMAEEMVGEQHREKVRERAYRLFEASRTRGPA